MPKKKNPRVNTRRIYLTPPGIPYPWTTDIPREFIPTYESPEIGDPVETEGYIDFLRIDEKGYSAGLDTTSGFDPTIWANYWLEFKTYCVVGISRDIDESTNIKEYRVLYTDPKGEELAVSMAVIATLKDAFLKRSRVRLNGIRSELETRLGGMFQILTSDEYYNLKSATLLRS